MLEDVSDLDRDVVAFNELFDEGGCKQLPFLVFARQVRLSETCPGFILVPKFSRIPLSANSNTPGVA